MKELDNEALQILSKFVNMDSGSCDKNDVDRFVDYVAAEFGRTGMEVSKIRQENAGDFLECTTGRGRRKILLLGHMDTVFSSGTASKRAFKEEGSCLYGPGVLDMKGGILVLLYSIKNVMARLPDDVKLDVFLNTDEEIGSKYSRDYILNAARDSIACLSFESAKPGTLTTERKGIIGFNMKVEGVAAHSGVNYDAGRSAIEEIARKICSLYSLVYPKSGITVNVGTVRGGNRVNIVADYAEASVEIRYFNMEDRNKIRENLNSIISKPFIDGTSTSISILSERPPLAADEGCRKLFDIASCEAQKLGRSIISRKTGGGGDASFASVCGVPVIDGLGPEGENSHTEREYVITGSIPFKIELVSNIILRIANGGA
jgi:Acetylornithine deacetylase/Succinyl-diaminopimelate desuccinylase and related deacylases